MDFYLRNVEAIAGHLRAGIKKEGGGLIGVELERFLIDKNTSLSAHYHGERGVGAVLTRLLPDFDQNRYSEGRLIALGRPGCVLSLEPAAQFECSLGAAASVAEIEREYQKLDAELKPILEEFNLVPAAVGYQPKSRACELPLIPKERYRLMDAHFKTTGKRGINMMRGTAATQVSVDYFSEEDASRKFRLANILAPVLSLMTDNAPVFEGAPYHGRMLRSKIWEDVDADRQGIVPNGFAADYSFSDYSRYILNSPAILVVDNFGNVIPTGNKKIGEIYRSKVMEPFEIEHALSMFFHHVRFKNYIEIRMADSLPKELMLAYLALVKGVFYNQNAVINLLNLLNHADSDISRSAYSDIYENGFSAKVYGVKVMDLIARLYDAAKSGNYAEPGYLKPLEDINMHGLAPKDLV